MSNDNFEFLVEQEKEIQDLKQAVRELATALKLTTDAFTNNWCIDWGECEEKLNDPTVKCVMEEKDERTQN